MAGWRRALQWIDSRAPEEPGSPASMNKVDWLRCAPFVALHLVPVAVIWVGVSWTAVVVAAALYLGRMFAITGFYHRYFSHRTFRTSRAFQFVMAACASSAGQRGPLWWAAHHRHHHLHSDDHPDHHSPRRRGFLMAHMGWFMTPAGFALNTRLVRDWLQYRELRFLDRFDWLIPLLLAVALYGLGEWIIAVWPATGTSGWQLVIWGSVISSIVLYHATYTINSLAHRCGSQRYATGDDSRNNFWLALLTLGEGWHNNHHHYPASVRQGFFWWEIDLTYYGLRVLSWFGLIWDLRPVPAHARSRNLIAASAAS